MDGRPGPKAAGVAKREVSHGRIGGRPAGSRASSPGEQAAACDCQKTRALGRGASRSLRLPNNSCAGLRAPNLLHLVTPTIRVLCGVDFGRSVKRYAGREAPGEP